MFERFTERARQVVVLAQEEARHLKHGYIGTEHLLLGLLREEEGLPARVLDSFEITAERVRPQVLQISAPGEAVPSGQIPFTPQAKEALERALREALTLGHDYIATQHLLLGLLREDEAVACRVLRELGATPEQVREKVLTGLDAAPDEGPTTRGQRATQQYSSERFAPRARQVIVHAEAEARRLDHHWVGTEHVLLGLLLEGEGVAFLVLDALGVTIEPVREKVLALVGPGEEVAPGPIAFTPRTKKVLELALREALSLGQNSIGTETLLLALVREGDGIAARVLLDLGADAETVRNEVIRLLSSPWRALGRDVARARTSGSVGESSAFLDAMLDGAGPALRTLAAEIEAQLGRDADAGDLIILLASVPGGLAARTLAALGLDADALARGVEAARQDDARSALLGPTALLAELDAACAEKEAAIEAHEFERAADSRDRERTLQAEVRGQVEPHQEELLVEVRAHLGLDERQ